MNKKQLGIQSENIDFFLEMAKTAAIKAGQAVMKIYNSGEYSIELKDEKFPLTRADKISDRIISEHLKKTSLPIISEEAVNVDFKERESLEYFWLIDPLDGTKEFINKNGEFTVNIALIGLNKPIVGVIYVPCREILYYGAKGTGVFKKEKSEISQFQPLTDRKKFDDLVHKKHLVAVRSRSHQSPETASFINQFRNATIISMGSSLKFMLLLENEADIYPRLGATMEWDTAAAHAILNASNRGVYQMDLKSELVYNKRDLKNPFFVAF